MPEIKDLYDRHPSIKSITAITGRVVSIDSYRLIDTNDNVYLIDIDSYRFIERFFDINFYRLPRSGLNLRMPRTDSKENDTCAVHDLHSYT